ncbi:cytochrome c oxidase subunit I [Vulgatibacter sp.]|uniref:cytochrome c oxidase subunit I n=1 Tax=Vulgatibacter sp. TaxID=1971226 RepID=UPI003562DE50
MTTAELDRLWGQPKGLLGFLSGVNHKVVGKRFMVTAFVFFLIAGLEALFIRAQLFSPLGDVLSPDRYNQFFTMHGSTMMFLFAVPFFEGLAIYVTPLMIGTRDMAFPRLNAFGYWVYLVAGITLHFSLIFGMAPDAGWFSYPPLSGPGFSPGPNLDWWVTMIAFLEVAALVAAVELIVTICKQRVPGMAAHRMPLFVWAILVMAFMIVFAMPPLVVASLFLGTDRFLGTHFFAAAGGGKPLLFQHLFWFFGHPDVYIILLPALGVISTLLPTAVRRPIVGYGAVVLAGVAVGFLSFGLWVHHMYAAGLPLVGTNLFSAASLLITIPNTVQIFAWIATIWRGQRAVLHSWFLYAVGFLVTFILGGITGMMVASVPFDLQVHDTHFVVAHFHYVLIGGAVFPIFAAIHFWFPKVTGRLLHEGRAKVAFALVFVGFHLTFFPLHILGLEGMPRRIYTYLPEMGWEGLNRLSTIGAFVLGLGVLVHLLDFVWCWFLGRKAPPNPWGASTLEWATASPPPQHNFTEQIPVRSRDPLWEPAPEPAIVPDRPGEWERMVVTTTVLDAREEALASLPFNSVWPFWLAMALSLAFLGAMVHPLLVPVGLALGGVALAGWHWPRKEKRP